MKTKNGQASGSVKINPAALKKAKSLCVELEVNVQDYITEAVVEKNTKTEKNLKTKVK